MARLCDRWFGLIALVLALVDTVGIALIFLPMAWDWYGGCELLQVFTGVGWYCGLLVGTEVLMGKVADLAVKHRAGF